MSKRLAGKVAVVTGVSKGIGASIAKHMAAEGAAVVVNYSSSKEGADRVVAEITANGGKAVAVQANVTKAAETERLFVDAKKAFGLARYSRQQRRCLRVFTDRRDHRRAFPPAVRSQCPRLDSRVARSGEVFRPRGRQHRQHQLPREHITRQRMAPSTAPPKRPSMP